MTSEEKFIRLIQKFDCAVAQLKHRGLAPSYTHDAWGLSVGVDKTWIIDPRARRVHPLALFLEGAKVSVAIYGNRLHTALQAFCNGYYPYLQLQKVFLLPEVLRSGFYEGYQNDRNYENVYKMHHAPDYGTAFEVGRHLINKHFNTHLLCAKLPLFDKI